MPHDQNGGGFWFPNEGYAVTGPFAGQLLDPMTRLHCTWKEWRELHPDAKVVALPHDPHQRDVREGHGAEEYWARPGLDGYFIPSLDTDELDRRLPENEMVIAVNTPHGSRTYPINHLHREGRVLNDDLNGLPLAAFCGPEQDTMKASIWERQLQGEVLEFEWTPRGWRDRQTGTLWSIEGKGLEGPKAGAQLTPVYYFFTRFHSWCYVHPTTNVWKTEREEAPNLDLGSFEAPIRAWREAGRDVRVERCLLNVERPLTCTEGLVVRVDGHRHKLHRFGDATSAEDYMLIWPHSVRRGLVVLESNPDPEQVFKDIGMQREKFPDEEIPWSPLLEEEDFIRELEGVAAGEPEAVPIQTIIEGIRAMGYEAYPGIATPMAQDTANMLPLLTRNGVFPGVENGMYVSIQENPFVIYRFYDADRAASYVENEERHAFALDRYVFRSIPINMFKYPRYAIHDREEDKVDWSEFLADEDFIAAMREIVTRAGEGAAALR